MLASVVLGHSEAAFVEGSVGYVVVGYGAVSEVVCAEDSKARVLVAISLKTYTQTTLVLTNSRPVGYEWMVILALPPALPPSSVAEEEEEEEGEEDLAVVSMQSPVNK